MSHVVDPGDFGWRRESRELIDQEPAVNSTPRLSIPNLWAGGAVIIYAKACLAGFVDDVRLPLSRRPRSSRSSCAVVGLFHRPPPGVRPANTGKASSGFTGHGLADEDVWTWPSCQTGGAHLPGPAGFLTSWTRSSWARTIAFLGCSTKTTRPRRDVLTSIYLLAGLFRLCRQTRTLDAMDALTRTNLLVRFRASLRHRGCLAPRSSELDPPALGNPA